MAGFLTPALRELRWRVQTTNPRNPAYWLTRMFGAQTATGIRVDGDTALNFSAVFASCRIYAQDVGTLPFPVYRTQGGKRVKDRSHPAWKLLNEKANPEMEAFAFRGALQGHEVLRGNGFAEIEWDQAMRPRALWPLRPDKMRLVRNGREVEIAGAPDGQLIYLYTLPSGQEKPFAPENILHLRGYSPDGLWGYSIVQLAREGIGLELAAQEYLGRFYANDARPGMAIKVPPALKLSDSALKNLKESWEGAHRGLSNAHRMAILEEGLDITQIGMNHDDAEFMASRRYNVTEWSRWTRLPPHMLADLERATFTNIEHQGIEYVKFSIRPKCVAWEQALLRSGVVKEPSFAEHNVEGLLRGDSAARGAFFQQLRAASAITSNQIAEYENLPTSDDPAADQLWYPLNSLPASAFDENGMTMKAKVEAVGVLVRAGFEPAEALAAMGLPTIAHTGLVPITVQVDADSLTNKGVTPDASNG